VPGGSGERTSSPPPPGGRPLRGHHLGLYLPRERRARRAAM